MDIILTNYFISKQDPQRKIFYKPDDYDLIKNWITSLSDLKLNGIIFYDNLSDSFIEKYTNEYVNFLPYKLKTNWSVNDERFLCWLEFLKSNPQYDNIITTDLFDVSFNKNPFKFIKKYKIYTGDNGGRLIQNNTWIKPKMKKLYGNLYHGEKIASNAGAIGGKRHDILLLFNKMVNEFKRFNISNNVNMCIFNKVLYDNFAYNDIYIGFPFTSRFKKYEKKDNYYIKHK